MRHQHTVSIGKIILRPNVDMNLRFCAFKKTARHTFYHKESGLKPLVSLLVVPGLQGAGGVPEDAGVGQVCQSRRCCGRPGKLGEGCGGYEKWWSPHHDLQVSNVLDYVNRWEDCMSHYNET